MNIYHGPLKNTSVHTNNCAITCCLMFIQQPGWVGRGGGCLEGGGDPGGDWDPGVVGPGVGRGSGGPGAG